MKIRSDMYEILQKQDQTAKTKAQEAQEASSFDALLLQAQASLPDGKAISADAALNAAMTSGSMIDPATFVAQLDGQDVDVDNEDASLFASLTEQADSVLSTFDQYAKSVGSGAAPRQMWELLNGMNGQLAGMRNKLETMSTPHAGLESLLNEMEVLTTTETFKMNRGDYQ